MKWTKKENSFRYSGEAVTRTTYTASTPLGVFTAYEAISGKVMYKHPFINWAAGGLDGYQPDPNGEIMPRIGIKALTLDQAKQKCEETWSKVKSKINQY